MANIFTGIMDAIFGAPETPEDQYAKAKADEEARQAEVDKGIDEIEDVFGQYGQDFYDKRSDAYMNYQAPQLKDQYKEGLKELQFALARGGRLNSSTEVAKKAGAAQDLEFQRQEMAGRAMQAAADSKGAVADAKEKMIKLNLANADPDLAASLSAAQSRLINQPAKYDQLTDVFGDITEGLASRQELENRRKIRDRINAFDQGSGSGTIVG
jgi:hypothetical protein